MWSTTVNDDVIINLFAVGSIECEINEVWAEFPSGFRYLLYKCSNEKEAREVFELLKKELMQAVPVRVCYHGTKEED